MRNLRIDGSMSSMPQLEQRTTAEVAEALGVDRRTVRRFIDDGALTPTAKLPGRTGAYLFDPDEVAALKVARSSRSTEEA